jgi:hypothetical protein
MGSAYGSPDGKSITAVYVNMGADAHTVQTVFRNAGKGPARRAVYVTDAGSNLKKLRGPAAWNLRQRGLLPGDSSLVIPPRSVLTAVYDF